MSFVLTVTGWLATLALGEIAVSATARAALIRLRPSYPAGRFIPSALAYGSACAAALACLGALPGAQGALLAALLAAACAWYLAEPAVKAARRGHGRAVGRRVLRSLPGHALVGTECLRDDLAALLGRVRRDAGPGAAAPAPASPAGPAPAPASRAVPPPREAPAAPSVREDPALGEAPAPAAVAAGLAASGVPVPPQWAALCDAVAAFEPDTDEDLLAHVAGEAAGLLTYAEAVRARADTLLHGTGLDPAYVAGHHELADEVSDLASAVTLVDRRFHAIYGAVREWVGSGGILPHNARQWFGDGGAAPQAGTADDGEAA